MDAEIRINILGRKIINDYRRMLRRHNDSGKLYNSVNYSVRTNGDTIELKITELEYGVYLNNKYNYLNPIIDKEIDNSIDQIADDLADELLDKLNF